MHNGRKDINLLRRVSNRFGWNFNTNILLFFPPFSSVCFIVPLHRNLCVPRTRDRERGGKNTVNRTKISRFKSFSMCLLQFPRMIDNYIGIIPTFRAAIYSIRWMGKCALANVIVMLKMCTHTHGTRSLALVRWAIHNLAAFDWVWLVQHVQCLLAANTRLAWACAHLGARARASYIDARENSKSEWEKSDWLELKRNIHQIYVLRVANETGIGATCTGWWCAGNATHSSSAHSRDICLLHGEHNEILNQCRLFYLLLFSGLVIVVYSARRHEHDRSHYFPICRQTKAIASRRLFRALCELNERERSRFDGLKISERIRNVHLNVNRQHWRYFRIEREIHTTIYS